jgi:hypothetical protein
LTHGPDQGPQVHHPKAPEHKVYRAFGEEIFMSFVFNLQWVCSNVLRRMLLKRTSSGGRKSVICASKTVRIEYNVYSPKKKFFLYIFCFLYLGRSLLGSAELTVLCEFGPPPYMPRHAEDPVSAQWEANLAMKELIKEQFAKP